MRKRGNLAPKGGRKVAPTFSTYFGEEPSHCLPKKSYQKEREEGRDYPTSSMRGGRKPRL